MTPCAIWELTSRLDLTDFYATIETQEGAAGREAIDPRLLISLWVYAYSQGVSSAREVSRLMEYHPGFQWLSGMRVVNHHTLSDFRIRHAKALDGLFTQVLGILSAEGLVTLERVMHDGTKIKANAGSDSFRREDRLKEHLRLAQEQVAAMGDPNHAADVTPRVQAARERAARERQKRLDQALVELEKIRQQPHSDKDPEEARASTSDPEARIMKLGGTAGYGPAYNVQLSTDSKAGAVVDVAVSQSPADAEQLPSAADRLQERLGKKPDQMVADAEFTTNKTVLEMQERGVDFVGSVRPSSSGGTVKSLARQGIDPAFAPEVFKYDPATNTLRCPGGKTLHRERIHQRPFQLETAYCADANDCAACPFRMKCCPQSPARRIWRIGPIPVIAAFRERMKTEAACSIYKQRGGIAEFTNAWIKDKLRLRQFRLRGRFKVRLEALWASLTLNIQLWIRRLWRPIWTIQPT